VAGYNLVLVARQLRRGGSQWNVEDPQVMKMPGAGSKDGRNTPGVAENELTFERAE
jgi:hypothetical protein